MGETLKEIHDYILGVVGGAFLGGLIFSRTRLGGKVGVMLGALLGGALAGLLEYLEAKRKKT